MATSTVAPSELHFHLLDLYEPTTTHLTLCNPYDQHMAFRVQTTAPMNYTLKPNHGTCEPRSSIQIEVALQAPSWQRDSAYLLSCKHKFLVRTSLVPQGTVPVEKGSQFQEHLIKVVFSGPAIAALEPSQRPSLGQVQPTPAATTATAVATATTATASPASTTSDTAKPALAVSPSVPVRVPSELRFKVLQLHKPTESELVLHNPHDKHMAFKVKCSVQNKYMVKPSKGTCAPQSSVHIQVVMNALNRHPADFPKCTDKFLIQTSLLDDVFATTVEDGSQLQEHRVKVVLEGPAGMATGTAVRRLQQRATPSKSPAVPSTNSIVIPSEVQFNELQLHKQSEAQLTLQNPYNRPMAFKVKINAPQKYVVRPSRGVCNPKSNTRIRVIMQALSEYPPNFPECKDKFLIQTSLIPTEPDIQHLFTCCSCFGFTRKAPRDPFENFKSDSQVEEHRLKVVIKGPSVPLASRLAVGGTSVPSQTADATATEMQFTDKAANEAGGIDTWMSNASCAYTSGSEHNGSDMLPSGTTVGKSIMNKVGGAVDATPKERGCRDTVDTVQIRLKDVSDTTTMHSMNAFSTGLADGIDFSGADSVVAAWKASVEHTDKEEGNQCKSRLGAPDSHSRSMGSHSHSLGWSNFAELPKS